MVTRVAVAVAVGVLVDVLARVHVAVGILVGVLDGVCVAVRVEVGFFVGDFNGVSVCAGAFVRLTALAVGATTVGDFVSDARENKLVVGEKYSVAELAGMKAGGASCVRPKLMNATVDARKRKLIPNNQRALRI